MAKSLILTASRWLGFLTGVFGVIVSVYTSSFVRWQQSLGPPG